MLTEQKGTSVSVFDVNLSTGALVRALREGG
jgi:hypothetical protein